MKWAVLIACHNRREKTLACLGRIYAQSVPTVANLAVFLVDDGSTDGTGAAVRAAFPEVRVISTDGSLFWNGGMRVAWEAAARIGFDAYVWLNDDTLLFDGAFEVLTATAAAQRKATGREGIVVGTIRRPESGVATYGALGPDGPLPPVEIATPVRVFNGNLVYVSRGAHAVLGNLNSAFRHGFGDIDYGLRAERAGVPVWQSPGYLAECRSNPTSKWKDASVPLIQRWRHLHGPKGCPPREFAVLVREFYRWRWPVFVLQLYVQMLFPAVWARWRKTLARRVSRSPADRRSGAAAAR